MPTPTEQRIMIAGSFDTSKIEEIKKLMEEEAIEFDVWKTKGCWEYLTWGGNKGEGYHKDHKYNTGPISHKQLYELFQQSKNK